jgi:hypothetical protein
MDGGTMCSAEKGFTVRVPELRSSTTLAIARCEKHGKEVLCLDNAFSLIEGHPRYRGHSKFMQSRLENTMKVEIVHCPT